MQAVIFTLMIPVISVLIWKRSMGEKKPAAQEALLRYVVYTLLITLLSSGVMVFLCEEGTSFWEKIDKSPSFVLKYAAVEVFAALFVSAAEWLPGCGKIGIRVDWEQYRRLWLVRFVKKYIFPVGIYLLAVFVIILNVRLMFDNVLWGDEAFSANTAQKSVAGIMQVLYYWDNHPPLYYYWLKLFGELFGYTVPVYHLASLVPFGAGILGAVTFLRRRFGNIPAAFFVMISGLASSCIEYNLEVRMYALAFFAIMACIYCSYRVLCRGRAAWFGLVFWALVAAYSHYYALVSAGILIFVTGALYWIRFRGKTWTRGLVSILMFIVGYLPWMSYLLTATENVSNNWWMTELLPLSESLITLTGGPQMSRIVLPLSAALMLILFLAESSLFEISRQNGKTGILIHTPSVRAWSDHTYGAAAGALTALGTIAFAYLLCLIMGPVLAERYLYPLSAVVFVTLVIACARILILLGRLGEKWKIKWLPWAGKGIFLAILIMLLAVGMQNYQSYSERVSVEEQKTAETLNLIGEPGEEVPLVTNGVQHLGWTVLAFYFPVNEVINGGLDSTNAEKFWYFTPEFLSDGDITKMVEKGYIVSGYGEKQLAKYPFVLYYFEKLPVESSEGGRMSG